MKSIRTSQEINQGNLDAVMAEVRVALLAGACSIIVTVDHNWLGATVLLSHPASSPKPDELKALAMAGVCIRNEIQSRMS